MDHDGQLTFSDDPILPGINDAFQLIEEGNFEEAVTKIDILLSQNPDYPGLIEGYRIARFWNNRNDKINNDIKGKKKADYLMKQWDDFNRYSTEKNMLDSTAYKAVMKFIFFLASSQYSIAFRDAESTVDNFDLLLKLGICFITLNEYKRVIDTLEYARSSVKDNAKILSILGEAYYHMDEIPKSLLTFREAFF